MVTLSDAVLIALPPRGPDGSGEGHFTSLKKILYCCSYQ